jgi:hypothetical protein
VVDEVSVSTEDVSCKIVSVEFVMIIRRINLDENRRSPSFTEVEKDLYS